MLDPDLYKHAKSGNGASSLEDRLLSRMIAHGIQAPKREYKFIGVLFGSGRAAQKQIKQAGLKNWRFDFAWPDRKIAVEVEGGTWVKGRHVQPKGYADDCDKYNHATMLGWSVYRFTSDMVSSGRAIGTLRVIFGVK